jgi:hypothetical protein
MQIKVDILKVIKVWMQRSIYPEQVLMDLRSSLMEVGNITQEDLDSDKPRPQNVATK